MAHDGAGDLSMWVGMHGSGAYGQGRRWGDSGDGWAWVVGRTCIAVIVVVGDGHVTCDALVMCHRLGCLTI